jgi:hypothetical protein
MPHIPSHVIDPPKSCGVLEIDDNKVKILHLPSSSKVTLEPGDRIGFLPMTMKGVGINGVLGVHVYKLGDYNRVEGKVKRIFPNNKWEELPLVKGALSTLRKKLLPTLSNLDKEIFENTLAYFKTRDFRKFYVRKVARPGKTTMPMPGKKAATKHAIDKVSEIMR